MPKLPAGQSYAKNFGEALQCVLGHRPARHLLVLLDKEGGSVGKEELMRALGPHCDEIDYGVGMDFLREHLLVAVTMGKIEGRAVLSDPCITEAGVHIAGIILDMEQAVLQTPDVPPHLQEAAAKMLNPTRP